MFDGRSDDSDPDILYRVGDLVRFSEHLFPPEVGMTSYYTVLSMNPEMMGIIIEICDPVKYTKEFYNVEGDLVPGGSFITQYYLVMWHDGMAPTSEKHYDLCLVQAHSVADPELTGEE